MVAEEDDPPSLDSGSILTADSIEDVGSPEGIGPGAEESHPAQLSLNALFGIPTVDFSGYVSDLNSASSYFS